MWQAPRSSRRAGQGQGGRTGRRARAPSPIELRFKGGRIRTPCAELATSGTAHASNGCACGPHRGAPAIGRKRVPDACTRFSRGHRNIGRRARAVRAPCECSPKPASAHRGPSRVGTSFPKIPCGDLLPHHGRPDCSVRISQEAVQYFQNILVHQLPHRNTVKGHLPTRLEHHGPALFFSPRSVESCFYCFGKPQLKHLESEKQSIPFA